MKLSPRTRANRHNARASTGPRTPAGKARAAKNALRHGLNMPVAIDPGLGDEIERLAKLIARDADDPGRLQGARRIAEAQIDVMRVRRARLALLSDPGARSPKLSWRDIRRRIAALKRRPDPEEAFEAMNELIETRKSEGAERTLVEGLPFLAAQLAKLDRYERRALSRRKTTIREFEGLSRKNSRASPV
jgi:hypothetical protein